jgi:DNA-binding MarR family transcriptional regulator
MNARVLCRLGRGPHDAHRLARDLEVSEPDMRRTVARLLELELITPASEPSDNGSSTPAVELTPKGRGLAVVAFTAARVEWSIRGLSEQPSDHSLADFLALLSPGAVLPRGLSGQCQFVESYPNAQPQTVFLRIDEERVVIEDGASVAPPDVSASAPLPAWDDALARNNADELLVSGDIALVHVVLRAFQEVIHPAPG